MMPLTIKSIAPLTISSIRDYFERCNRSRRMVITSVLIPAMALVSGSGSRKRKTNMRKMVVFFFLLIYAVGAVFFNQPPPTKTTVDTWPSVVLRVERRRPPPTTQRLGRDHNSAMIRYHQRAVRKNGSFYLNNQIFSKQLQGDSSCALGTMTRTMTPRENGNAG